MTLSELTFWEKVKFGCCVVGGAIGVLFTPPPNEKQPEEPVKPQPKPEPQEQDDWKASMTPEQRERVEKLERSNKHLRRENNEMREAYDEACGRMSRAEEMIRTASGD